MRPMPHRCSRLSLELHSLLRQAIERRNLRFALPSRRAHRVFARAAEADVSPGEAGAPLASCAAAGFQRPHRSFR
jgi:hypothetical protein